MTVSAGAEPTAEEISVAQSVFSIWNGGNQQQAIEALRSLADEGRPWAVNFISWLFMQQGPPTIEQGIPYAKRAAQMGMPWSAVNLFNNLMAHVPANPNLLEPALNLLSE